jgi:hypothetical protein
MEMHREAIARHMRTTAPRCIKAFTAEPADPPEKWKGNNYSVWQLYCQCGCEKGKFLGYPLRNYNPQVTQEIFVGPLAFECSKCGETTEILDTALHGYHAETCSSPSSIRGEGPRKAFACLNCGRNVFLVVVSFFYWEAALDLVEDEPEEFSHRSADLFNEFQTHGRCAACDNISRFTDFGKL